VGPALAGGPGGVEGDTQEKRGRWAGCEAGVGIGASWAAGGERPRGAGPSERGRSGLGLTGKEKGRAGWAQGKETGQAKGENWAGVLGKGLESWVLLWVPLFYFDSKTNTQVGIQMRI